MQEEHMYLPYLLVYHQELMDYFVKNVFIFKELINMFFVNNSVNGARNEE